MIIIMKDCVLMFLAYLMLTDSRKEPDRLSETTFYQIKQSANQWRDITLRKVTDNDTIMRCFLLLLKENIVSEVHLEKSIYIADKEAGEPASLGQPEEVNLLQPFWDVLRCNRMPQGKRRIVGEISLTPKDVETEKAADFIGFMQLDTDEMLSCKFELNKENAQKFVRKHFKEWEAGKSQNSSQQKPAKQIEKVVLQIFRIKESYASDIIPITVEDLSIDLFTVLLFLESCNVLRVVNFYSPKKNLGQPEVEIRLKDKFFKDFQLIGREVKFNFEYLKSGENPDSQNRKILVDLDEEEVCFSGYKPHKIYRGKIPYFILDEISKTDTKSTCLLSDVVKRLQQENGARTIIQKAKNNFCNCIRKKFKLKAEEGRELIKIDGGDIICSKIFEFKNRAI